MNIDFSIFPNGPIRSDVEIAVGNSIEANDIRIFFAGKKIDEITIDLLNSAYSHDPAACLAFMSPIAFAFFLPLWMKISLNDFDKADAIPETVIGYFLALAEGKYPDKLSAIMAMYSSAQLGVVALFLREMSSQYFCNYPVDRAQMALLLYWQKYDANNSKGSGSP
ncbi:MAG TPA: DUF6714 family protein [Usitatibacteraceae bacterium]